MMLTFTQIALSLFGILPANFSGITHIEGNRYAIVDDKDRTDGFRILTLDIDSVSGKVTNASLTEPTEMAERRRNGQGTYRDCEGIAYCNATNTLFVSGEEDQRIMEYTLDGAPTGRELAVPLSFQRKSIRPNLGFEALSYDAANRLFWTTTESTLPADGESSSLTNKQTVNRLRLSAYDIRLQPTVQFTYTMDLPTARATQGTYAHGVPSIVALPDGRFIIMEREAYIADSKIGSFCTVKLFLAYPSYSTEGALSGTTACEKELITSFTTNLRMGKMDFANYEGMCLGPKLADGRQTLILISDSQNGAGNALFHLKDYVRVLAL